MLNTFHPAPVLCRVRPCGPARQIAESFVLLAVAVIIFRGFIVEGYMISTGSMAPTLLGYHHDIVCPDCEFKFAHGAAAEEHTHAPDTAWASYDLAQPLLSVARCPNCGYQGILTDDLPRTEGDQLLVHKHAYEFRDPRRWEVIVFRNPGDPQQAYVKRVAGLPGETIEIRNGNLYADGQLARKPYVVQRAVRVPVSSFASHVPAEDPDHQPAWVPLQNDSSWQQHDGRLSFKQAAAPPDQPVSWMGYRHWIHSGGRHLTQTELAVWPKGVAEPGVDAEPLRYSGQHLQAVGVLTDVDRRNWLARSDDPAFQQAIHRLCELSHLAPLTDDCGYNSTAGLVAHEVQEFQISLTLDQVSGPGRFEIELSDGDHVFAVVFRFFSHTVELLKDGDPVPLRSAAFSPQLSQKPLQIDFSLFDQQAVLAVNGRELFAPCEYGTQTPSVSMRRPVRIGATGIDCEVTHLQLYRDLHYLSEKDKGSGQYRMGPDEFFVLGDNSPVSVDSRVWENPAVPRSALIGKPLVVHLPSRSQPLQWGGKVQHVRMPDFSRVRLVR